MSKCVICQQIYDGGREMTCSDECHEELVRRLVADSGEFKKVVHAPTGVAYKVPTMDIIEKGLRGENIGQYPIWEENQS